MKSDDAESPATQFAITNLNIPDRLDLRDIDDRKQTEEVRRARIESSLRWIIRIVLACVLLAVAFGGIEAYGLWRNSISPASISERLTGALGVPVTVEGSRIALSPSPRLVIDKVKIESITTFDQVSIGLGVKGFTELLRGKGIHWGEATIHSASVSLEQARSIVHLVPRLGPGIPHGITVVRIERLELTDQPWIKGAAVVTSIRDPDGRFSSATLVLQSAKSNLRIQVNPAPDSRAVRFQLEGKSLVLPSGPGFAFEDVIANGEVDSNRLYLEKYSLGGPFGLIEGRLLASQADGGKWSVEGTINSDAVDVESLIRLVSPLASEDDKDALPGAAGTATPPTGNTTFTAGPEGGSRATPIQGTATFTGRLAGTGASLEEALGATSFSAPVHVRWAVLNGVDLGYLATHPGILGGGGGSTRFTSMDVNVTTTPAGTQFSGIVAKAGALAALGNFSMRRDLSHSGNLHVDLGTLRVQAPIRVEVHGTLRKPEFGH